MAKLIRRTLPKLRVNRMRMSMTGSRAVACPRTIYAAGRACGSAALAAFAAGLDAAGPAVRAAMTQPWSGGLAEWQITKPRLIKHPMYGRAGFDLPRCRVLLAS